MCRLGRVWSKGGGSVGRMCGREYYVVTEGTLQAPEVAM